jgi:hypothetical protein
MDRDNKKIENNDTRNTDPRESHKNVSAEEGSKSDPQLTELDGLKKGGVHPHVHPSDKPRDPEKDE